MVATVTGNTLGLVNTSVANGLIGGNANVGQTGEGVYVNSATGNLVVRSRDEYLAAVGLDLSLARTYNSQGLVDGDNDDNWRIGVYRSLALSGAVNTVGSTVTKTFGDGAEVLYTFDGAKYVSTEGEGAHDTLGWNGSEWTWTEGTTRDTETYNSAGQLTSSKDRDGNTISYDYTGSLLTAVTDASGQVTYLDYSGNNLTQIRVVSQGQTQTLTHYDYDGGNRLQRIGRWFRDNF